MNIVCKDHLRLILRASVGTLAICICMIGQYALAQDDTSTGLTQTTQEPSSNNDIQSEPGTNADETANLTPEPFSSLEHFEAAALEHNPTLVIARARINASEFEAHQAGLKTNPVLGVWGEEIGNDDSALLGVYYSRTFRRGGKRHFDREVKCREVSVRQRQYEQQELRVLTDVRTAYFNLLIAQRQAKLAQQLFDSQSRAAQQIKLMYESQESPKTDYYQAEIKARQIEMRARQSELARIAAWRALTAVTGLPDLPPNPVKGSLDDLPQVLEWDEILNHMLSNSPEIHAAQAKIEQSQAAHRQALANGVPNLQTQFTLGHDTSTDDTFTGFQIGMPYQINNQNRGNISAAQERIIQAEQELRRVQLSIQNRLASVYRDYKLSCEQTLVYIDDLLPKARQTLDLVTEGYREGEVSFVQLLAAQQITIDLTVQYLRTIQNRWNAQQRIEGMLLTGSLNP